MADPHVGDIGTVFKAYLRDGEAAVDVSSATTKQIKFKDPDGTVTAHTAAFTANSGTDGVITYTTADATILATDGRWEWQGYVVLSSGTWHSEIQVFHVLPNLS